MSAPGTDMEGAVHEVAVERLAYGGDGVGRLPSGRAVFIPGTAPGDVVKAEVTHVADRFARARVVEVAAPGKARVAAACPHAGVCGGCPWQQIAYPAQLDCKRQAVVDALTRQARMGREAAEGLVEECRPSKRQWNYRNKVEFEVTHDGPASAPRLVLGLHAAGSEKVVPVTECRLLPKKLVRAPKQLGGALRFLATGDLTELDVKRVGIRASLETGSREVALWTPPSAFPRHRVGKVLTDAVHATSVVRVLVKGPAKARKVAGVEKLAGAGFWEEEVGEERMRVTAPSFFQVNTAQAARLVELVLEGLDPGPDDVVLDLYSGAGTFTLPLARRAGEVVAVEVGGSSTRDLEHNLDASGLFAEVVCDDVARALPDVADGATLAVIDPPRQGLSPAALDAVSRLEVRRLVYVSCDPATLGRDLARLAEPAGPFAVKRVTPVDLFPQTYHVETVVVLERG